jgi:hypothetical protein
MSLVVFSAAAVATMAVAVAVATMATMAAATFP